jgi:hypothetical protein
MRLYGSKRGFPLYEDMEGGRDGVELKEIRRSLKYEKE